MFFEIGAVIFGLIQGVLVMLDKRSNWIAYALQMAFLLIFSIMQRLYGDAANAGLYLILGVIGFVMWGKEKHKKISACSWKERIVYTTAIALGTLGLFLFLRTTDDPLPLLDAFTTVSSLIATYYMLVKKIDTWIIWFVNDIFYVIEYWLLPDPALYLLGLNLVWTALAVFSYLTWRKIMRAPTSTNPPDEKTARGTPYRYVCIREQALDCFSESDGVTIQRFDNGLILVDADKPLVHKGLVDVTKNERYCNENLSEVCVKRVAIEGTDGVGKTSVIKGLIAQGIVCFDRDKTICRYMLFDVDMATRCKAYETYFTTSENAVLFLINNDKAELERRVLSRGHLSEFDEQAYAYNELYQATFAAMKKYDSHGKLQLCDCTGLTVEEQIERVKECILQL